MGRYSSFKPVQKYFFYPPAEMKFHLWLWPLGFPVCCQWTWRTEFYWCKVDRFSASHWIRRTNVCKIYKKNFREQTNHPFTIQCLILAEIVRRWGTWRSFVYVFCTAKVYCKAEDQWQNNRKSLPGLMDRAVLGRSPWLSQQSNYTFIGYVGRPCILKS